MLGANNSLAYKAEEEGHPTVLMAWNDEIILTFSVSRVGAAGTEQ